MAILGVRYMGPVRGPNRDYRIGLTRVSNECVSDPWIYDNKSPT